MILFSTTKLSLTLEQQRNLPSTLRWWQISWIVSNTLNMNVLKSSSTLTQKLSEVTSGGGIQWHIPGEPVVYAVYHISEILQLLQYLTPYSFFVGLFVSKIEDYIKGATLCSHMAIWYRSLSHLIHSKTVSDSQLLLLISSWCYQWFFLQLWSWTCICIWHWPFPCLLHHTVGHHIY